MEDKKAENILVLDLSKSDGAPAEYFVIGSCLSEVQVDSVSSAVERGEKKPDKVFLNPKVGMLDNGLFWIILML